MTEIDYEALADAMSRAALDAIGQVATLDDVNQSAARAVAAAYEQQLRGQGFVVVKAGAYELMQSVVETAREIQREIGERPVDITNETRWELDPVLLNLLEWNMNALSAALAAPGDGGEHP
jgi:hypothetical protein